MHTPKLQKIFFAGGYQRSYHKNQGRPLLSLTSAPRKV